MCYKSSWRVFSWSYKVLWRKFSYSNWKSLVHLWKFLLRTLQVTLQWSYKLSSRKFKSSTIPYLGNPTVYSIVTLIIKLSGDYIWLDFMCEYIFSYLWWRVSQRWNMYTSEFLSMYKWMDWIKLLKRYYCNKCACFVKLFLCNIVCILFHFH